MIIREFSLVAHSEEGAATLTLAVGKAGAMAEDLPLHGPSSVNGGINIRSADLAAAMHDAAAALAYLATTF